MERLAGRVAVSYPPYAQSGWVAEATPAQRRKLWENGVRALASVQQIPLEGLEFLAIPAGFAPGLEQEFNKFVRFIEWISADQRFPVLDAALARLRARWPANQPAGLVWADARLGNLMFDDNFEVVAMIDWEQPSLGGALHDLSWWLFISDIMHSTGSANGHLEGMGTRAETIALWQECTGIQADDLEWYDDLPRCGSDACRSALRGSRARRRPICQAWHAGSGSCSKHDHFDAFQARLRDFPRAIDFRIALVKVPIEQRTLNLTHRG